MLLKIILVVSPDSQEIKISLWFRDLGLKAIVWIFIIELLCHKVNKQLLIGKKNN